MKENTEYSFAREILQDYKLQNENLFKLNKSLIKVICVLLLIIFLFVGGLVYFITNYDLTYEEVSTDTGNACIGDNCGNGDINGESN